MSFKHSLQTLCFPLLAITSLATALPVRAQESVTEVRLYTLDCGHIETTNLGPFSDTGEYDGKPGTMVDPCFVIRHPKGTLLWDTGLGDKLAESKDGQTDGDYHLSMPTSLAAQLSALKLTPADITYVAFSHFHFDHTGNANLFGASTWILNKAELAWGLGTPSPTGVAPDSFSSYKTVKTQLIDGDYDVFGDGSVQILKAPGHTPGHQVLELKLTKAGTVLLAGDLYHLRANRQFRRVPTFNYERADTLASMDRIEKIAHNTKARVVVQHDPIDFKALPKFPAYLN